ncbi:MAG: hypothetical protein ABL857_04000, partial [Rickettsiales bacterium]
MKIKFKNFLSIFMILAIASYSGAALANKYDKHGKKHEKHKHHHSNKNGDSSNSYGISFGNDNKIIIRKYLAQKYAPNCPPGLAKKHNGCLPPGQAKKNYVIGQALHSEWRALPHELLTSLGAPPTGHQYVMVDKDVLLISE